MGLDITAYSKLTPADASEEAIENGLALRITPDAIARTESLWPGRTEGLGAGCYHPGSTHSFKAGSYGGYAQWRRQLAYITTGGASTLEEVWAMDEAGTLPSGTPFLEQLNFSDCEGHIGPVVAKKLAKDYADWQAKVEGDCAKRSAGSWFVHNYNEWRKAFELASDGGVVEFH